NNKILRDPFHFSLLKVRVILEGNRKSPGKTGIAKAVRLALLKPVEPLWGKVGERIAGDISGDLFNAVGGRDQFVAVGGIDSVEAGPSGGRGRDAEMDLLGPRLPDHFDDLSRCGAAHDGIVDQDHPLPL